MEQSTLAVQPVASTDLPELTTIFTKSFHPVSSYMRQAIPDTALTRRWWNDVNEVALNDPEVRLIKAVDSVRDDRLVAIARYRIAARKLTTGDANDSGTWSKLPLTKDHDLELCTAFMDFMGNARKDHMEGRRHVFIELLATDHDFKGQGAGRLLVERICEDADLEGLECFVETNSDIVPFYEKFGFMVKEEKEMPGRFGYREFIMVKSPRIGS